MRLEDIVVEVRNRDLARVGVVTHKHLNLELNLEHNGVSSWRLELPTEHHLNKALRTPGSGVIVTGPHDVLLSGPMVTWERSVTPEDRGGTVIFNGVSDSILLSDYRAWPDPINPDIETQALSHDERTGVAETLMHEYVAANIGRNAPVERRHPRLSMGEDNGRGAEVTKSARFPTLGALLQDLATPDNLGFRIVQRGDGLVFETYETSELVGLVRMSMHNRSLSGERVIVSAPSITRAIVAGSGRYVDRSFFQYQTDESADAEEEWGRRIEHFIDQRQTKKVAEYEAAALEALEESGFTGVNVQAVPAEDSTMEYGKDWSLGDLVTVEVGTAEMVSQVTGFVLKANDEGLVFGAILGELAHFKQEVETVKRIQTVEQRVSALERHAETPEAVLKTSAAGDPPVATALAGWTIHDQQWVRTGDVAQCYLHVERTGADITGPAGGNIANTLICTVPSEWSSAITSGLHSSDLGPMVTGAVMDDEVYLTALAPGATLTTGETLSLGGTYVLASAT